MDTNPYGGWESAFASCPPYGDGRACQRIADAVEWRFGLRPEPPEPFQA